MVFINPVKTRLDSSLQSVVVAVNSIPGWWESIACYLTGSVGGWYNQVEWMMLPGVFVGKVIIIR